MAESGAAQSAPDAGGPAEREPVVHEPGLRGPVQRVVLTGFMGAGKTTVGRMLAADLRWTFLDLDDEISADAGLSVPQIFAAHGEAYFRALETQALQRVLGRDGLVLALGGGALESDAAAVAIETTPATAVVFLQAPFSELLERCERHGGAGRRPLLKDVAEAQARYDRRLPRYAAAHLTVDTSANSAREAVRIIQKSLSLSQR